MATQGTFNPGQEAASLSASPNISTVQARFDPNADVNSLVSALGSDANLNRANSMYAEDRKRKTIEQTAKIETYTQQIRESLGDGSVTAAQVGETSPELVHVVRMAITESIGKKQGVEAARAFVQSIDEDSANLSTAVRQQRIDAFRAEQASNEDGDDFYRAGMLQGIDSQLAQNQQRWQAKTDAYHTKVQEDDLAADVTLALRVGGDSRTALAGLDAKGKERSSLSDLKRKDIIVGAAIDTAMADGDLEMLDQIPTTLLNAALKVKVGQARGRILEKTMSDSRAAKIQRDDVRAEANRSAYQEINTLVSTGQPMNPANYLHLDPNVYIYAIAARDRPTLSDSQSVTNASIVSQHILTTSTLGDGPSTSTLRDQINGNKSLNPKEQVALVNELAALVEGRDILADPRLRNLISTNIAPALADMQQHPEVRAGRFDGISLRADVMSHINAKIRSAFVSEHTTSGVWPTGNAATVLIDKAIAEGEAMIIRRLDIATSNVVDSSNGSNAQTTVTAVDNSAVNSRASLPIPSAMPKPPTTTTGTRSTNKSLEEELAERLATGQ